MGFKVRSRLPELQLSGAEGKLIVDTFEECHAIEARKVETRGCPHFIQILILHPEQRKNPGCWLVRCYCAEAFVVNPKLLS